MIELASGFVTRHSGRPWSLITAAGALFLPVTLAIFIERPELFSGLGVTATLMLSAATSLPFVLISTFIWYQLIGSTVRAAMFGRPATEAEELALSVQTDDPMEATLLYAGAATANIILYAVALAAYFKDISLSRTYVNVGLSLLGVCLSLALLKLGFGVWLARQGADSEDDL